VGRQSAFSGDWGGGRRHSLLVEKVGGGGGLGRVMTWMTERSKNGIENKALYD
jgi:hypothetical protein